MINSSEPQNPATFFAVSAAAAAVAIPSLNLENERERVRISEFCHSLTALFLASNDVGYSHIDQTYTTFNHYDVKCMRAWIWFFRQLYKYEHTKLRQSEAQPIFI